MSKEQGARIKDQATTRTNEQGARIKDQATTRTNEQGTRSKDKRPGDNKAKCSSPGIQYSASDLYSLIIVL